MCDEVEIVLPGWVQRCVASRWSGDVGNATLAVAAQEAGEAALAEVMPRLRALLAADVDAQRGTPLTILRDAVRFPTDVLTSLGADVVARDPFAVTAFPADVYDLSPATWADVDERLAEPGLRWSVAKAYVFKRRHEN